jgi:ornithine cyclodeaminase/alanine dehydrogenase-like protein (mu-crystallin family)
LSLGRDVLVLERRKVAELLTLDDCIAAVEKALAAFGRGEGRRSEVLGARVANGGFHVKAAVFETERSWFVAKTNANFPGNPQRLRLPTIQGAILAFDGDSGRLLAVMDTIEITLLRTAAATAVAARRLARPSSRVVTVAGCGEQGRVQLMALHRVLPIERAFAWDLEACRSDRFAAELSIDLGIEIEPIADLAHGATRSDVTVTCTPSREYILAAEHVAPGAFVAAVGADHPEKREIHPGLMAAAKVVVDDLDQCAHLGDLHHALEGGAMTRAMVHAELPELVAGRRPGRTHDDEITIFDSTGIALEDAAAAALVVERATARGDSLRVALGV